MNYDFDKIIDRSGSGDFKHEVLKERYGRDDILPLWVADMDFLPLISSLMQCESAWSILSLDIQCSLRSIGLR